MPIYEYVCKDCKAHFEELVSLSSPQIVKCKQCGGLNVKKTVSTSNIKTNSGRPSIPSGALSGCSSKSGFS